MTNKVVFVNRFFHPDISATSQMLSDLAFPLSERHQVQVVTSRLTYERRREALASKERLGQTIVWRPWTTRFGRRLLAGRALDYLTFYLSVSLRLLRLLKRGDVVVAMTDPPLLSVPLAVVARLKGAAQVNWLHDVFPEIAATLDFRAARLFLQGPLAWLRDRSLSSAVFNVVLGERMAQLIAGRGVPAEAIRIIPNWACGDRITPIPRDQNPLRISWGLAGKFVVGYSGNFGRAHEFEALLAAARQLSRRPELVFLLIGDGRQHEGLQERVRAEELKNIVFKPYQPRVILSQSLSAADCHIVSLKPALEGLIVPSKVYSAMAAARPVIFLGASEGEIPGMMARTPFGVSLRPEDADGLAKAIESWCDRPQDAESLGEAGRLFFEREFDQPIALAKWESVLTAAGLKPRAEVAGDAELSSRDLQICPSCGSAAAHRSRSRTRAERVRRDLKNDRLYRCHECGWRGWLMPLDAGGSQGPVDVPAEPDFDRLDAETERPPVRAREPLDDLDRL